MAMGGQARIFISYSRRDAELATRLAIDLKRVGMSTWMDTRHIQPGAHWDSEIQRALGDCSAFLVLLTPESAGSENVLDELNYARGLNLVVIPVMLRECNVPLRLARVQWIDLKEHTAEAVERAAVQIKARLGQGARVAGGAWISLEPHAVPGPHAEGSPAEDGTPRSNSVPDLPASFGVAPDTGSVRKGRRKEGMPNRWMMFGVGLAIVVGGAAVAWHESSTTGGHIAVGASPSPSAAAVPVMDQSKLRLPNVGEEMLEAYSSLDPGKVARAKSQPQWRAAEQDFDEVLRQQTAPEAQRAAWEARRSFAHAQTLLLGGYPGSPQAVHERLARADVALKHAVQLAPDWALPQAALVDVLLRQQRPADAEAPVTALRRLAPQSWLGPALAGARLAALGLPEQAIVEYELAHQLAPDSAEILGNLALAYNLSGLHDAKALELAQRAIALAPNTPSALTVLAERALHDRKWDAAVGMGQQLVDARPSDPDGYMLLADAQLARGELDAARLAFTRSVQLLDGTLNTGAPTERIDRARSAAGKSSSKAKLERLRAELLGERVGKSRPGNSKPKPKMETKCYCSPKDPLCSCPD